jgi:hypothetical protein
MKQQLICLFLERKGLSARADHTELPSVLGADAIAYSMVNLYLWQRLFPTILTDPPDNSLTIVIDHAILEGLENQPFSLIRELAKLTDIPTTQIYPHVTQSLGFVVKHLHCVPHSLTAPQKAGRVTRAKEL